VLANKRFVKISSARFLYDGKRYQLLSAALANFSFLSDQYRKGILIEPMIAMLRQKNRAGISVWSKTWRQVSSVRIPLAYFCYLCQHLYWRQSDCSNADKPPMKVGYAWQSKLETHKWITALSGRGQHVMLMMNVIILDLKSPQTAGVSTGTLTVQSKTSGEMTTIRQHHG